MLNINFVMIERKHLPLLYEWRASTRVSQFQLSDMRNSFDEHVAWFEKVIKDCATQYWIIEYANMPIGVFNLADIDQKNKKLTAGFYIGDVNYLSIGALIPPFFYNYIFFDLKFNKIWGEVFQENTNVRKIHRFHGFREVGTLEKHILKGEVYSDIVIVELLSERWLSLTKYHKYKANFMKDLNVEFK